MTSAKADVDWVAAKHSAPPCAWVNLQDVWVILIPLKNIYQELKIKLGGEEDGKVRLHSELRLVPQVTNYPVN